MSVWKIKRIVCAACFILCTAIAYADLLDVEEDSVLPKKIQKIAPTPRTPKTRKITTKKRYRDPASYSEEDSKNCRVYFRGDELVASKSTRNIHLKKNVEVTRCNLKINSQAANIFLGDGSNEVEKVTAKGSIKLINDDITTGQKIRASGQTAIYEKNKQIVTLLGSPAVIFRGKSKIKGNKIIYQMLKGTIKVSNVKGTLYRQDAK